MSLENLPAEILLSILHYLGPRDCATLCGVGVRSVGAVAGDAALWRWYCYRDYGMRVRTDLAMHTYQKYLARFGYRRNVK